MDLRCRGIITNQPAKRVKKEAVKLKRQKGTLILYEQHPIITPIFMEFMEHAINETTGEIMKT